jgi:hypothetical protein
MGQVIGSYLNKNCTSINTAVFSTSASNVVHYPLEIPSSKIKR